MSLPFPAVLARAARPSPLATRGAPVRGPAGLRPADTSGCLVPPAPARPSLLTGSTSPSSSPPFWSFRSISRNPPEELP